MGDIFPGYRPPVLDHISVEWFNVPVTKSVGTAGTPGTPDADAMAEYGMIGISEPMTIDSAHLHQVKDGSSGTTTLELFRQRGGVRTQIGSISVASGSGDFGTHGFTITDPDLEAGDYLMLQATATMTSGGQPKGFVDVHFKAIQR